MKYIFKSLASFLFGALAFCILLLAAFVMFVSDNQKIEVTNYEVASNKIDGQLRIVQVSDLHDACFGENNDRLVKEIENQRPDAVFLTGDMFDGNRVDLENTLSFLKGLSDTSIPYVFYTPGNHEIGKSKVYEALIKRIEEQNLRINVLLNSSMSIDIKGQSVNVIGIYEDALEDIEVLKSSYSGCKDGSLNLVLCHFPERIPAIVKNPELYFGEGLPFAFDFAFTGHAHGGQFRLLGRGLYAPDQGWFPKYTDGLISLKNGSYEVISRGLGNSSLPIRINNTPELIVLDITKEELKCL